MKEKEGEREESERPRAFHEATSERTSERDSGPRESAGSFCRDETDPWISAGLPIRAACYRGSGDYASGRFRSEGSLK